MTTPHSIATAVSEQAFTKRTPVRGRRSRRRAVRYASLLLAVAAVLSFVMQPSRAAAIPVSERTACWIALTSRNIALDCSALTRYAWAQAGVEIERGSAEQYARAGRVARDEVQVGDLVWYPGHIMFSLGTPELIIHARSGERSVEIHRIDSTRVGWMRWVSPLD